jgi:hypothetical protein
MQERQGNYKYKENKIDPFFLAAGETKWESI